MKYLFTLFFLLSSSNNLVALEKTTSQQVVVEPIEIFTDRDNNVWRLFGLNETVLRQAMSFLNTDENSIVSFFATLLKQCEENYRHLPNVQTVYFTLVKLANNSTNIRDAMRPITVATLLAIYHPHLTIEENFRHGFFASSFEIDAFIEVSF